MTFPRRLANPEVTAKIEDIFESIADSLFREDELAIPLKIKESLPKSLDGLDAEHCIGVTHVSFPAKTQQEAWRFTVLIRILELIHEALCENVVVSKRNIYYKDPALFKSQAVVDRYVDLFAYNFGVQRAALNVTAAAKGLAAGDFTLTRLDGTTVPRGPDVPHLIDDVSEVLSVDISGISWILVVEKESTFRTLASSRFHQHSSAGKGIILTVLLSCDHLDPYADNLPPQAKGYPDISTRSFLRLLSTSHFPPPPIYALSDFDPDGIAIISNYKHGSWNLSHENANLNVPSIRWLGVHSQSVLNSEDEGQCKGLLRLSGRDRKKAVRMLENNVVMREDGQEPEWRRELHVMLMLNVKAEMEILGERKGGVVGWVAERLLDGIGCL